MFVNLFVVNISMDEFLTNDMYILLMKMSLLTEHSYYFVKLKFTNDAYVIKI